jgi:hypothetical protein
MATKNIVTYKIVHRIADELTAAGKPATSWGIRKRLGRGSNETILKHLRELRATGQVPVPEEKDNKGRLTKTHILVTIDTRNIEAKEGMPIFGYYQLPQQETISLSIPLIINRGRAVSLLPVYNALQKFIGALAQPIDEMADCDPEHTREAVGMRYMWQGVICQAFTDICKHTTFKCDRVSAKRFLALDNDYSRKIVRYAGLTLDDMAHIQAWCERVALQPVVADENAIIDHAKHNFSILKFYRENMVNNDEE